MKKQKHRTSSGKMSERMSLLEFLKERSGIRLSKLEAYLDLVDKASVQYIPKDLCKQEFSLSNGQFVITITELAGCWHWHRATVRTFICLLYTSIPVYVQLPASHHSRQGLIILHGLPYRIIHTFWFKQLLLKV